MGSKSDIGLLSVVVGISAGIITAIIFVVDDNLRTQRLSERIAAKRYEIKMKRSKILSLMQQDAAGDDTPKKSDTNTDDSTGVSKITDSVDRKNVSPYRKGVDLDNLGKYEEAEKYHDKAFTNDPKFFLALNKKGAALENLGKYKEAIEC
jgi:tetratricopeptide (TPR) repeat protein